MFLEFPEDPFTWSLDLQYMFGESLLIAPVLHELKVEYYLPPGTWTNILTGKEVAGRMYVKEEHDMMTLSVMFRPDHVLIIGKQGHKVVDSITDKGFFVVLSRHMLQSTSVEYELRNGKKVSLTTQTSRMLGPRALTSIVSTMIYFWLDN